MFAYGIAAALITFVVTWYIHVVMSYWTFTSGKIHSVSFGGWDFLRHKAIWSRLWASVFVGVAVTLITGV